MAQWIRQLTAKPGDMCLSSQTKWLENQLPQMCFEHHTSTVAHVRFLPPLNKKTRASGVHGLLKCRDQMFPSPSLGVTVSCVNGRAWGRATGSYEGSCESWDEATLVGPVPGLVKAQASGKSRCLYPWVLEVP